MGGSSEGKSELPEAPPWPTILLRGWGLLSVGDSLAHVEASPDWKLRLGDSVARDGQWCAGGGLYHHIVRHSGAESHHYKLNYTNVQLKKH